MGQLQFVLVFWVNGKWEASPECSTLPATLITSAAYATAIQNPKSR